MIIIIIHHYRRCGWLEINDQNVECLCLICHWPWFSYIDYYCDWRECHFRYHGIWYSGLLWAQYNHMHLCIRIQCAGLLSVIIASKTNNIVKFPTLTHSLLPWNVFNQIMVKLHRPASWPSLQMHAFIQTNTKNQKCCTTEIVCIVCCVLCSLCTTPFFEWKQRIIISAFMQCNIIMQTDVIYKLERRRKFQNLGHTEFCLWIQLIGLRCNTDTLTLWGLWFVLDYWISEKAFLQYGD